MFLLPILTNLPNSVSFGSSLRCKHWAETSRSAAMWRRKHCIFNWGLCQGDDLLGLRDSLLLGFRPKLFWSLYLWLDLWKTFLVFLVPNKHTHTQLFCVAKQRQPVSAPTPHQCIPTYIYMNGFWHLQEAHHYWDQPLRFFFIKIFFWQKAEQNIIDFSTL